MTSPLLEALSCAPVLPVVVCRNVDSAAPLGDVLILHRYPCAEITLRTPAALRIITALAVRSLIVGAGTVLNAADVDAAVDAGAQFLVSPGVSDAVITRAHQRQIPLIPGVLTPSDVMRCLDQGLTTMKLFPAGGAAGIQRVQALSGPFPAVRFIPTGGISLAEVPLFLARPEVVAVGGSWMVPPTALDAGEFHTVAALLDQTMTVIHGHRGPG